MHTHDTMSVKQRNKDEATRTLLHGDTHTYKGQDHRSSSLKGQGQEKVCPLLGMLFLQCG